MTYNKEVKGPVNGQASYRDAAHQDVCGYLPSFLLLVQYCSVSEVDMLAM